MDGDDVRPGQVSSLLALTPPAVLVGVGSALTLIALSVVSAELEELMFERLPDVLGVSGGSGWWIFTMLTLAGLLVGVIVWKAPGHAGPDPATVGLVSAPLSLGVLPALVLTVVIGLGMGVSLGPENPIIAINTALAVWLMARLWRGVPVQVAVMLAAAATMGAMFGTPVAAALLFTEMVASKGEGQIWDRLFAPLVAAGSGALTMVMFERPVLSVDLPAYGTPHLVDLVSGAGIAMCGVLVGLVALYAFPLTHRVFHRLGHPVLMLTAGGMVLGGLGALGGTITLFKGLDEMKELAVEAPGASTGHLVLVTLVKLVALVVAASCGFRGGRIFPAVFVGVGVGLVAHSVLPSVPASLAVASGVLGMMAVVARDGWLALFMSVTTVGDIALLPVMCVIVLPVWLLVTERPDMIIRPAPAVPPPPPEPAPR